MVLLGARLNWQLHFGLPPRWREDLQVIQVDTCPEELHNNVRAAAALCGDVGAICSQLLEALQGWKVNGGSEWWKQLGTTCSKNKEAVEELACVDQVPLGYYRVFKSVRAALPSDCVIVSEVMIVVCRMNVIRARRCLRLHFPGCKYYGYW